MGIDVRIPTVGESITEVTIASWQKKDGDYVEMDEVLCELESDKATFELNAEAAGVLKIKAEEGATVPIGEVICILETDGTPSDKPASSKEEKNIEKPSHTTQVRWLYGRPSLGTLPTGPRYLWTNLSPHQSPNGRG